MVLRNPDEITNKDVKKLLRKHAFYEEVNTLSKILRPIKTAIAMIEDEQTNLADVFIQMIHLAYTLKNTVTIGLNQFQRHVIQVFNKRWRNSTYRLIYWRIFCILLTVVSIYVSLLLPQLVLFII